MTSLQERRDAQTRAELSATAIGLFAEHGFAATTMEDVAVAAGVSRRTVYRHYPNKEDLIFEQPKQWLEVFRLTTGDRTPGDSTQSLCERGALAVADTIEATKADVLPGLAVVAATPELRNSYARMNRDWLEEYTGFIASAYTPDDTAAAIRSAVIAGALVGGTDSALTHWFISPGASLVALTEQALESVAALWGEADRSPRDPA